jgi:hypothetical protein
VGGESPTIRAERRVTLLFLAKENNAGNHFENTFCSQNGSRAYAEKNLGAFLKTGKWFWRGCGDVHYHTT